MLWWNAAAALHAQPKLPVHSTQTIQSDSAQSEQPVQPASDSGSREETLATRQAPADTGIASFYSSRFQGRTTASGEVYDENKMTAAHNRLKFGTRIRVTNLHNGRSVIVRVNDRMHSRNPRLVDLSRAAAIQLGFIKRGLTRVRVERLPGPAKARE